jgi:hypothetical protein
MKISQSKLKQLILEELANLAEIDDDPHAFSASQTQVLDNPEAALKK